MFGLLLPSLRFPFLLSLFILLDLFYTVLATQAEAVWKRCEAPQFGRRHFGNGAKLNEDDGDAEDDAAAEAATLVELAEYASVSKVSHGRRTQHRSVVVLRHIAFTCASFMVLAFSCFHAG